jgi:predicted protein tyrosine phosphatase
MSERLKILFVCGRDQKRSATAAKLHQQDFRLDARSVGLSGASRRRATSSDLIWADLVLVMKCKYAARIEAAFPGTACRFVPLDIPDDYEFTDPDLIELLRFQFEQTLETE